MASGWSTADAAVNNAALRILEQARAASGGAEWDRIVTLEASGSIEVSKLPGRWSRIEDVRTGRWTSAADVRVFRTSEGFDGRVHWRQDPSGAVHALNGAFSVRMNATESWLVRRAFVRRDAGGAAIAAPTTVTEGSRAFTVIEATPRGGEAIQLWFDAATHLLDRTVRKMPISTLTVRYGDYRAVGRIRLPFTIESRDSGTTDVEIVRVERWTIGDRVDVRAFRSPQPPDDVTLDGETTVPIDVSGLIGVEATLNGHTYTFILDTGGHNIITPAVAQALGLTPKGAGASGGAGTGELAQQYVRIDRVDIGRATLVDQHFYVIAFPYDTVERGSAPPFAGILGLELFERFAVRLDYPHKKLTLRKIGDFRYSGRGRAVPITFDDDMPLLQGRINGVPALMALDTGNSSTTVVQRIWAQKNGLAERLTQGIETVSYGAGGASRNWASRLDTLEIAGTVLERPIGRYAEDEAGAFASRTEAANIGTEVLANFILDFDYRRGVIWFEHVAGYVPAAFNRAGLRTIKESPQSFRVTLVVPNGPADRAGILKDDRVVAVDGIAASQISGREVLFRRLTQAPGTTVVLTVRRGDQTRDVDVTLAELLP